MTYHWRCHSVICDDVSLVELRVGEKDELVEELNL